MRIWQRSAVDGLCGGPCKGTVIRVGDPIQLVTLVGVARKLVRCRHCADSPVPADLPALVVNKGAPIVPTLKRQPSAFALPLDFKMAQAGREVDEREPGSDDV